MTLGKFLFDLVVAGLATAGFGLMFRAQGKSLLPGAVIGGVGYVVYDWIVLCGGSATVGSFVGALVVGVMAELAARLLKGPTVVFANMGVIPLVPGYGLFHTMEYIVKADYINATAVGFETLMIAGAIAAAVGFSNVMARRLLRMRVKSLKNNG